MEWQTQKTIIKIGIHHNHVLIKAQNVLTVIEKNARIEPYNSSLKGIMKND
jgi:hypothetical protein